MLIDNGYTRYSWTHSTYDKAGKVTAEKAGRSLVELNNTTEDTYDKTYTYEKGQLKVQTDSQGRKTEYTYDGEGRVSKLSEAISASDNRITLTDYNYLGQATSTSREVRAGDLNEYNYYNDSVVTLVSTNSYDLDGNLISKIDAAGNETKYSYDKLDRVIKTVSQLKDATGTKDVTTSQTYTWDGQVASQTDANGNTTKYDYDAMGHQTKLTDALGNITLKYYDLLGRNTAIVAPRNYKADALLKDMEHTAFTYDAMGRVLTQSFDSNKSGNASFIASDIAKSQEGRTTTEAEIESWRRSVEEHSNLSPKKSSDVVENKNCNQEDSLEHLIYYNKNVPISSLEDPNNRWTGDPINVVSPVWQSSDVNYSPAVQSMLLELNFDWYFADSIEEQNRIVQRAKDIRADADDGMEWWLDKAGKIVSAAADEFSWFLGGSPSANERDKWLEINQLFQSDLTIKDNQSLKAGMFIAGILMPGPGSGEANAAGRVLKSWIKHGTYNEVKETLGKEGVEQFIKAMNKGIVGGFKENGIKLLSGEGIEAGGKYYKYELKVLGKGTSHYRILGNFDENTGHVIFEKLVNK